jgi:hypothetical protein
MLRGGAVDAAADACGTAYRSALHRLRSSDDAGIRR